MPTVYAQFLKCEEKQNANQPKIMAGVNAILAKFPIVKDRILPTGQSTSTNNGGLVYAVMSLSCDDLSGLAKPGFLGIFSKLGSLGAGLALRKDYISFLNLISNPANPTTQQVVQQDLEYYKALQATIKYLNDNKDTFFKYLMSIPHVDNYLGVIKNELSYINDQLTKMCFDQEKKKLGALEQMLIAKTMEAGNSDPIKDIQDIAKIAQDVTNLKLLDVYGGINQQKFTELCEKKIEQKLENHLVTLSQQTESALAKKNTSTQTLQVTIEALQTKQTQLATLQEQFPQQSIRVAFRANSEKIDKLVEPLISKQQEIRPFEIVAAAKKAAEEKAQMKIETMSQRGRDSLYETRPRSRAVIGKN